jgi:hypothetical protein
MGICCGLYLFNMHGAETQLLVRLEGTVYILKT